MKGFYAHHFSVSMALCDGDAYLLSIATLPLPPSKEGSRSFTTPMLMRQQLTCFLGSLALARELAALAGVRLRAKIDNINKTVWHLLTFFY